MTSFAADIAVTGASLSRADLEKRFNDLLVTHGPALARLAHTYARASGDREDLFQEIAIAIWRALPGFRGECSERTFLFRIAHNRGMSHLARRRPLETDVEESIDLADARPNPEQALSSEERSRRLFEAVQQLPLLYRQVLTLALEGMSYDEIAEVIGISQSNVGARLTRAREMLRQLVL
jgi:RNA polymerase sigma-70 factor, ECF subfamily